MRRTAQIIVGGAAALGLTVAGAPAAAANPVVPRHAVIVCQTASFYENYDSAAGPHRLKWVLTYGNKVGHTPGAHPVYNGWAATFDFGPNDWGFVRIECIGGYDSW